MCRLDELKKQKEVIYSIAEKHKAIKLYVFGSCARKEERKDSDIDFLADFEEDVTYLDIAGLFIDLSDYFKCKVDVIPMSALSDLKFASEVTKDMVLL